MDKLSSILDKTRRIAARSFDNAVRLHEDAVLLFQEDRIPSALHTCALSIEEIGKYFLHEEVWWHNTIGEKWPEDHIQKWLESAYSHKSKQMWFAGQADHFFVSKTLVRILQTGELEKIKQRATYVGFPRKGRKIDFDAKLRTPFRASKRQAIAFLTAVNDYLIVLSLGTRKGVYGLDIPEIDDWLATKEFEEHFLDLWSTMRPSTRRHVERLRKLPDIER